MGGAIEMLRSARDFTALQRAGRSRVDRLVVVRCLPNEVGRTRFGIATGRRLGSAVARNRVRRRIREVLRRLAPRIVPGWDVLVVARPASAAASFVELSAALERLLRQGRIVSDEGSDA